MLGYLPAELVVEIISLLGFRDVVTLGYTCKDAQLIVRDLPNTFYR